VHYTEGLHTPTTTHLCIAGLSSMLRPPVFVPLFLESQGRSAIESRWGRDFPSVQTGPGAHPTSCKMGAESFPGVKCGRGVLLTTHPLLVPRSWKSRAIPLPTLWATPGLQRVHFTYSMSHTVCAATKQVRTRDVRSCGIAAVQLLSENDGR
jgi:hypothetical protein